MAGPEAPAESSVIADRQSGVAASPEGILAEILAGVLRVDRVSPDSHFFDDLRADSLVMAHFCARVRKRGGLPPVSMRDVYRHPTIRSLTAALMEARRVAEPPAAGTAIGAE